MARRGFTETFAAIFEAVKEARKTIPVPSLPTGGSAVSTPVSVTGEFSAASSSVAGGVGGDSPAPSSAMSVETPMSAEGGGDESGNESSGSKPTAEGATNTNTTEDSTSSTPADTTATPTSTTATKKSAKKDRKKGPLGGMDPAAINTLALLKLHVSIDLEDPKGFAGVVEEELFKYLGVVKPSGAVECGSKYKSKYRTLQFNLKDPRNLQLRRRILTGATTPHDLVRMSPEELANEQVQTIAEQVRRESIYNVVKVKAGAAGGGGSGAGGGGDGVEVVVAKTHKGEVEIRTGDDA
ncbi:hypothetical protein HK102_011428, partial [Quaeritorhiza haematococci]